jgi:hypothetical protein
LEFLKKEWPWAFDFACIVALFSIAFAVGWPRFRVGIDWQDEGLLAYGAVRVAEGQVPNRDFVTLQPPLSFYVAAGLFKLIGTSLGSLRILGLLIHILLPLLIYIIGRNLMNRRSSMVAALPATIIGMPYFGFVPLAVWQGITASLIAGVLYLKAVLKQRRSLAFFAGIVTTLSVCLRHDQGLYLAVSIAVLTIALSRAGDLQMATSELKPIVTMWLFGAGIVAITLTLFWHTQQALPAMFKQLVVFPITTYWKTSSHPFQKLNAQLPLSLNAMTLLYYLAPAVAILASTWIICRIIHTRFYSREAFLTFLVTWSLLFYCQVLTRSDPVHLLITFPPLFILLAYCWGIVVANFGTKRVIKIITSLIAGAVAICFLCFISPVVLPNLTKMNERLSLPRGGVRIEYGTFTTDFIRRLQDYVPRDRPILALPYQPMFYFLCERRNPTRWNYLWPGDQTIDDYNMFVEQLKNDPPVVVLVNNENQTRDLPFILDYLHREYRHVQDVSSVAIYVPRAPTP